MEYDLTTAPEARLSRYNAASGGVLTTPLAMADSGNQWYGGIPSYNVSVVKAVYKNMVDSELARPPKAELSAVWERVGNQVKFTVHITNQSGVSLSSLNGAYLHGIVYEDKHVLFTSRIARAAKSTSITSLADGASAVFTLQTSDLTGVDWSKLHYIVMADYRPGGLSGAYDMLQAAVATSPTPDNLLYIPIAWR